jgi:hypothetical protein
MNRERGGVAEDGRGRWRGKEKKNKKKEGKYSIMYNYTVVSVLCLRMCVHLSFLLILLPLPTHV